MRHYDTCNGNFLNEASPVYPYRSSHKKSFIESSLQNHFIKLQSDEKLESAKDQQQSEETPKLQVQAVSHHNQSDSLQSADSFSVHERSLPPQNIIP
jgi:hypothetical protein